MNSVLLYKINIIYLLQLYKFWRKFKYENEIFKEDKETCQSEVWEEIRVAYSSMESLNYDTDHTDSGCHDVKLNKVNL